ncbi:MAG: sugar phosphate isomerase/epimerase family protein [Terriglobia bacterium]
MSTINRRDFMRKSAAGLASLPALATLGCSTAPEQAPAPPKPTGPPLGIPVGLQLYTLRDTIAKDFEGVIKQVAEIGYKNVEVYDFYGKKPEDVKKILDDNGLRAPSGHWMLEKLRKSVNKCIDEAKGVGCEYLIMPILEKPAERRTLDQYKRLVEYFNKVGEQCKKADLTFGYHNHNFEFQKFGDTTAFDFLLTSLNPEVAVFEMDCFWVTHAGQDPVAYMEKYPGRFPLLHIKDLVAGNEPATELDAEKGAKLFAEVGKGTIDWKRIFAAAPKGGLKYYYVEQDYCAGPPIESIKVSYDYLKGLAV